jgi:hypothetical protein
MRMMQLKKIVNHFNDSTKTIFLSPSMIKTVDSITGQPDISIITLQDKDIIFVKHTPEYVTELFNQTMSQLDTNKESSNV